MPPVYLTSSASNVQGTSNDFTTMFQPNLILGGKKGAAIDNVDTSVEYEVALIAFNGWNTIPNIDATLYNNNQFQYTHIPTATTRTVTFPTGNYSFSDMQVLINQDLVAGGYAANSVLLIPNISLNKVYIQVAVNFQVNLVGNWRLLAGFDAGQSPILSPGAYGNNNANIQNGQEEYLIHCSATDKSSYGGYGSDVIYTYRPTTKPGSAVTNVVFQPQYFRCARDDIIDRIRIYVTDQLQRPITYNGEDISITLNFRPITPVISEGILTRSFMSAGSHMEKKRK